VEDLPGGPITDDDDFGNAPTHPGVGHTAADDFGNAPTNPGVGHPAADRLDALPPGGVIYGDRPLSRADAVRSYRDAIAELHGRSEAMIVENMLTGELVVIQGTEEMVGTWGPAWNAFLAGPGRAGPWRVVRHYHGVGAANVTEIIHRYPSGKGGDLAGAREFALAHDRMHVETLDIVTENGDEQVYFGYDPAADRPYFVGLPRLGGLPEYHYFETLGLYHEWVEQRIGQPFPELPRVSGVTRASSRRRRAQGARPRQGRSMEGGRCRGRGRRRKASAARGGDRRAVGCPGRGAQGENARVDAGEAGGDHRQVQVARGGSRGGVHPALDAGSRDGYALLPPGHGLIQVGLRGTSDVAANARIAELLPIVMGGLRDPGLYADVIADVEHAAPRPRYDRRADGDGGGGRVPSASSRPSRILPDLEFLAIAYE
jgi:hypothetical protein